VGWLCLGFWAHCLLLSVQSLVFSIYCLGLKVWGLKLGFEILCLGRGVQG